MEITHQQGISWPTAKGAHPPVSLSPCPKAAGSLPATSVLAPGPCSLTRLAAPLHGFHCSTSPGRGAALFHPSCHHHPTPSFTPSLPVHPHRWLATRFEGVFTNIYVISSLHMGPSILKGNRNTLKDTAPKCTRSKISNASKLLKFGLLESNEHKPGFLH